MTGGRACKHVGENDLRRAFALPSAAQGLGGYEPVKTCGLSFPATLELIE